MYMTTRETINSALKVLGLSGMSGVVVDAPNALKALDKILTSSPAETVNRNRLMAELKRQSLVHIEAAGDSYHFTLTPAGIHRLQQSIIDELKIEMPAHWDKKWRIVSFDIPLNYSRQRAAFVVRLRELGFTMMQKSLWVHPADCFDVIERLAGHYNLLRFCTFIEASKLDEQSNRRLLRLYNL